MLRGEGGGRQRSRCLDVLHKLERTCCQTALQLNRPQQTEPCLRHAAGLSKWKPAARHAAQHPRRTPPTSSSMTRFSSGGLLLPPPSSCLYICSTMSAEKGGRSGLARASDQCCAASCVSLSPAICGQQCETQHRWTSIGSTSQCELVGTVRSLGVSVGNTQHSSGSRMAGTSCLLCAGGCSGAGAHLLQGEHATPRHLGTSSSCPLARRGRCCLRQHHILHTAGPGLLWGRALGHGGTHLYMTRLCPITAP